MLKDARPLSWLLSAGHCDCCGVPADGRPDALCAEGLRTSTRPATQHDSVERTINKLKQFTAVSTPYDKRDYAYLGTVTAAALLIWLSS